MMVLCADSPIFKFPKRHGYIRFQISKWHSAQTLNDFAQGLLTHLLKSGSVFTNLNEQRLSLLGNFSTILFVLLARP